MIKHEKALLFYIAALIILSITLMYSYADADQAEAFYKDPILIALDHAEDELLSYVDAVGCDEYPDSLGCQIKADEIEDIQKYIALRLKELGE